MGKTIEVDNLDEMCDLMCDNKIPKQKQHPEQFWVFTFGCGQEHAGYYVKIWGTFKSARQKMFEKYGDAWSFQYSWDEWLEEIARISHWVEPEKELEVIK